MLNKELSKILKSNDWIFVWRTNPLIKCVSTIYNRGFLRHAKNSRILINYYSVKGLKIETPLFNYFTWENKFYARNILEDSGYFNSFGAPFIFKDDVKFIEIQQLLNKQWVSMSNAEILCNFELLSYYASKNLKTIDNPNYYEVLEVVTNRCNGLEDKELYHLLNCLRLWNENKHHLIKTKLWKILNYELYNRLPNWKMDKIFLTNHLLQNLRLFKDPRIIINSLMNINLKQMSPANLTQFLFLLKLYENIPYDLNSIEYKIEKYIDELTIEEIGIIAMTYFRRKTKIRSSNLILKLMKKLEYNINDVTNVSLSAILKILRYNVHFKTVEQFDLLLKSLIKQIPRCTIQTLAHLSHVQATFLYYNKDIVSEILERFKSEIKNARLKDLERVLFLLHIFNYNTNITPFYTAICDELLNPERIVEIKKYPKSLIYCVLYMIQNNFYSNELLELIMDHEFIMKSCENDVRKLNREYLIIDYCIELEHPQYKGPRVKKTLINFLLKQFGVLNDSLNNVKNISQGYTILTEVIDISKTLLNSQTTIYLSMLLPHFPTKYIVLCRDLVTNQYYSPEEELSKLPLGAIKYAPKNEKKWYAILIATRNHIVRNNGNITGTLAVQMRHLERIGYTPILISHRDWQKLTNVQSKQIFLQQILLQ